MDKWLAEDGMDFLCIYLMWQYEVSWSIVFIFLLIVWFRKK
jgi:hypothetical protein